jgi:hypothetical protein
MTNSVIYLDKLLEYNNALLGLPVLPLVFVACLVFGYALKAIPIYRNAWIPFGVFTFGILANTVITPLQNFRDFSRAFLLGMIAGGCAWFAHRKFLRKWLGEDALSADTDPAAFVKPPEVKP